MKNIKKIVIQQKEFFLTGETRSIKFRKQQLKKLKHAIIKNSEAFIKALSNDFNKSEYETVASEIGICLDEINFALKHIKKWSKPKTQKTPLLHALSHSFIFPEPYGVCLIIGPWNYPVNLVIAPLIGAIAAGNCAVIKPSELTENTSQLLDEIISKTFDEKYICSIEGGVKTTQSLLAEQFDYIFFTGSTHVGKIVLQAAAKKLIPVTLELGGKNPCIVDKGINIEVTAKRIVWGKFFNGGQTCIAPDYLYVHKDIKKKLLNEITKVITQFYGENPKASPDFPRIINQKNFIRLNALLKNGSIVTGGESDKVTRYIAPTVINKISWNDPVMAEEIFGPILPVLDFKNIDTVINEIQSRPKPLALYLFSNSKKIQKLIIQTLSFGGAGINETFSHIITPYLPFGGVGASGMGNYHGKASFDTFTHYKSLLKKPFFPDLFIRYPPYTKAKLRILKKIFKVKY